MEILLEKYHHANSLLKKGKIDKAVNIYLELLDKDFRKKEVLEKLVWLYFENYDFDNAEKYIDLYLGENPISVDVLSAKVCILFKNKEFSEALTICNKMIEIDSESQIAYSFKLSLLEVLGRNSERERIIKFLKKDKPEIYKNINYFDGNQKKLDNNNSNLQDFYNGVESQIETSDDRIKEFFNRKYLEITRDSEDLTLYNFLISDKNETDNKEFNALLKNSQKYFDEGNFPKSLEYISWALEFYPNNIEALLFKALIYINVGDFDKALTTVDSILELNRRNVSSLLLKGLIYIYTKQYNRAQIIFKQLLNDHDNDVTLWRFYYMSVAITGDYLRALQINYDAISKFQDNKSLWKDYHYFETKVDKIEKQNLRESFDKSYKKGSNFKNSTLDDFF